MMKNKEWHFIFRMCIEIVSAVDTVHIHVGYVDE